MAGVMSYVGGRGYKPGLQDIRVGVLAGTLPPEWSSMNLTYLKLDRNLIRGGHFYPENTTY